MTWRCTSIYQVLDKREDWRFLEVGQVEINAIRNEVLAFYDEWLINTHRQDNSETHKNTFVFEMLQLDYLHGLDLPAECIVKESLSTQDALKELQAIYKLLEDAVDGKVIRAEFVNMNPKSRVRTHKDRSDLLYVGRRFHIPIKTNPDVIFVTGGEAKHLEHGTAYELNNIKYHSVHNKSTENRVHLIIDILPKEYCGKLEYKYETK